MQKLLREVGASGIEDKVEKMRRSKIKAKIQNQIIPQINMDLELLFLNPRSLLPFQCVLGLL